MGGKRWTPEELEYLRENWGSKSIATIAYTLGRSRNAVLVKKNKLGLGAFLDNHPNGAVSICTLFRALGKNYSSYTMVSWVKNRGLPIFQKKVERNSFKMIDIDKWWKWAEKNQDFLDFSKFEPLSLGAEPDWVAVKRAKDKLKNKMVYTSRWTKNEDERLMKYLKAQKYTVDDIAKMLQRTDGAVQRRISTLGLKERPIKAYCHNHYSSEEINLIKSMIVNGCNYYEISKKVGRSEKAIRGKIYAWCKTENLDKAKEVLKNEIITQTDRS